MRSGSPEPGTSKSSGDSTRVTKTLKNFFGISSDGFVLPRDVSPTRSDSSDTERSDEEPTGSRKEAEQKADKGFFELLTSIRKKIKLFATDERIEKIAEQAKVASGFLNKIQAEINELSDSDDSSGKNEYIVDGSLSTSIDILVDAAGRGKKVLDDVVSTKFSSNPFTFKNQAIPILESLNEMLALMPLMVDSYVKSGVSDLFPDDAPSIEEIQLSVSKWLSTAIQGVLEKRLMAENKWTFLQALKFTNDEQTLRHFSLLPKSVQYGLLVAMQEVNNQLLDTLVWLDEVEIRNKFKEGKLLDLMKIKFQFDQNSPFHQLSLNQRTLKEFCIEFSESYKKRMAICGWYEVKEDIYPYERSKFHARKALLKEVQGAREKTLQKYEAKLLTATLTEALSKIGGLRKRNKDASLLNKMYDFLENYQAQALSSKSMDLQKYNIDDVINMLSNRNVFDERFSREILDLFVKIKEYRINQEEKLTRLSDRLNKKINDKLPEFDHTNPDVREDRYSALQASYAQIKEDATNLIKRFEKKPAQDDAKIESSNVEQQPSSLPANVEVDNRSIFEKAFAKMEEKLKALFDADIYQRYFENAVSEDIPEQLWIKEIGQSFLKAKQSIAIMQEAANQLLPVDPAKQTAASPCAALLQPLNALQKSLRLTNDLADSMRKLHSDPCVKDCAKELCRLVGIGVDVEAQEMAQHPWYRFVKSEGETLVKQLRKTKEIFETAEHLKKIADDFLPMLEAANSNFLNHGRDISLRDKLRLVFSHAYSIRAIIKSMPLSIDALSDVAKEKCFIALIQLMNVLRELYLYLDKMETVFYFKRGLLTTQPLSVMGFQVLGGASVGDLIRECEKIAEKMGLNLLPEQRFPYEYHCYQQGLLLQKDAVGTQKAFIQKRVAEQYQAVAQSALQRREEQNRTINKRYVMQEITQRIKQLDVEISKSWFFTRTAELKIKLLMRLHKDLRENKSLSESLLDIKQHGYLGRHYQLLFSGRTGKLLQDMQASFEPADVMVARVQKEIDRLNVAKESRSIWTRFFDRNHYARMTRQIEALQALYAAIDGPFVMSLDEKHVKILERAEPKLLNQVRNWKLRQIKHQELFVELPTSPHKLMAKQIVTIFAQHGHDKQQVLLAVRANRH